MKKLYNSPKLYNEKLFEHDVMAESSDFSTDVSTDISTDTEQILETNNIYDSADAIFNY